MALNLLTYLASMRTLTLVLALLVTAAPAEAAARLTYHLQNRPTPIGWGADAFPLPIHIGRSAAQNLPTGEALILAAFRSWENVEGSRVAFRHAGMTDAVAGRDGVNIVTVNNTLNDVSGFLAFTTTWFNDTTGELQEVDIQIDANAVKEGVSLPTLVQHEIGHLLGFDHSGIVSSVMYPWVGATELAGLDSDDLVALAKVYPDGLGKRGRSAVRGEVRMPEGAAFGAQVVAVDRHGSPVSSTLSDADGGFEISGLPAGTYLLYAEPLDGPVEARNLSGIWRAGVTTGFRTEFLQPVEVVEDQDQRIDLMLNTIPSDLNPRWIGAFAPDSSEIRLESTPVAISAGSTMAVAVGGDGFYSGFTTFEILSPSFQRVSEFSYGSNYTWATFRVAPDATPGSVVIVAKNGEVGAALTGALRVLGRQGGRGRAVGR